MFLLLCLCRWVCWVEQVQGRAPCSPLCCVLPPLMERSPLTASPGALSPCTHGGRPLESCRRYIVDFWATFQQDTWHTKVAGSNSNTVEKKQILVYFRQKHGQVIDQVVAYFWFWKLDLLSLWRSSLVHNLNAWKDIIIAIVIDPDYCYYEGYSFHFKATFLIQWFKCLLCSVLNRESLFWLALSGWTWTHTDVTVMRSCGG